MGLTHIFVVLTLALVCSLQAEDVLSYDEFVSSDSEVRVAREVVRHKRQMNGPFPGPVTTTDAIKPNIRPTDNHDYYTAKFVPESAGGADRWREIDQDKAVRHKSLQSAHRLAVKVDLHFPFLFYGHMLESVTIATGGFLYMSDFLHSFLTASQYIAPLMANFDTSLGTANESEILYSKEDDAFIVQWRNVFLRDNQGVGPFEFQVQLYKDNGTIVAAYKEIPIQVTNISTDNHPVKVGLSDAYYWDVGAYRTIYPYHTVNITDTGNIKSNTAIVYNHLQTCNMLAACDTCMDSALPNFKCYWCSKLDSCSDSFDRQRQDWVTKGCLLNDTQTDCNQLRPTQPPLNLQAGSKSKGSVASGGAVAAALCTIFGLSAAIILGFVIYGYRNPEGGVGQFMIRNRPANLWRKFKTWKDKDGNDTNPNMSQIG